jgi:hypothetical protein
MSDQTSKVISVNQVGTGMIIQHGTGRNKCYGVVTECHADNNGDIIGFETLTLTPSSQPMDGCRALTFADSRDIGLNNLTDKQFFLEPEGCLVANDKSTLGTRAASEDIANVVGEMNSRHFNKYVEKTLTKKAAFNLNSRKDFAVADAQGGTDNACTTSCDKIAENMIFKIGVKPDPFFKPQGQQTQATGYDVSLGNAMTLGLISQNIVDQLTNPRTKSQPATLKNACEYIKHAKSSHAKALVNSNAASQLKSAWGQFMGEVLNIESTPTTAQKYHNILMRPSL